MKILIGKLGAESNSFATERGTMERFAPGGFTREEKIFDHYRNTADYLGGVIKAGEEEGVEMIPSIAVLSAVPLLDKEVVEESVRELCSYVSKYKDEIDGFLLCMHGGGAGVDIPDMEAYTLSEVRKALGGKKIPVMSSLDLHGNITEEMCELSDGLFGIKHYPHIDENEAGYRAMKTLIRTIRGELRPQMALRRLPLMIVPSVGYTFGAPMKEFTDHVAEYAKENGLIDASFFQGFPYTDVPGAGASVVVIAEKDAQKHADALAKWIWERREKLIPECLSCEEAVDRAEEELKKPGEGYVVINETSDNPGGGTPGDGTYLLREFLKRNEEGMLIGAIADKEVVDLAMKAGIGGKISGTIGGKTDHLHGEPIAFKDAEVLALSDGKGWYESPMFAGLRINNGNMARLRMGNVEVTVKSKKGGQGMDDQSYLIVGANINKYKIIGLKSSVHFRAWFDSHAKAIVTADPPGIQTSNYSQLTFKAIPRPAYPIDPDTEFHI